MSTSSAGRAAGENGAGHVADTKRFNSDSACPISVHVVDAQVSTDDEPSSFKRRGSNENGGAKLSRMNSMPINSRNRDSGSYQSIFFFFFFKFGVYFFVLTLKLFL